MLLTKLLVLSYIFTFLRQISVSASVWFGSCVANADLCFQALAKICSGFMGIAEPKVQPLCLLLSFKCPLLLFHCSFIPALETSGLDVGSFQD